LGLARAGERRDHRSDRQQIGANEEQWKRYLYDSKPMLPLISSSRTG
jgi:hypothetical protein